VKAGWVAGSVRARLLLERRAGPDLTAAVAGAASLDEAIEALRLSRTGYAKGMPEGTGLEEAQHAVAAAVLLAARVLAAWLPRDAAVGLRALASWFELVNIEDRIAYLSGGELRPAFELGVLASAWQSAAETSSLEELRRLLGRSAWGDVGGDDPRELHLALRLAWAKRVAGQVPAAQAWAAGAVAILLAAEMFVAGRFFDPPAARGLGLGDSWPGAGTVAELRRRLPRNAGWTLDGIDEPADLWRAEIIWWLKVGADAEALVRSRLDGDGVVVGAVALLALDAVRVNAALAVAERSSAAGAKEVLDALG